MIKTQRKKLVLSSDTVRTLARRDLTEVAGGVLTRNSVCLSAPCVTDTCGPGNCI